MAPWVAVVLVQATVYRSVFKGLQQLVAIAVGTLLAAGAGLLTGNTVVAVALVLPVVMLLSYWPRLGDQGIYGPTTALFTLTSGAVSDVTVSHRLLQAVLGAAIGIAINALILPPVHLRDVREHLSGLARGTDDILASIADGLTGGEWDKRTTARWHQQSARLQRRLECLRSARQLMHDYGRVPLADLERHHAELYEKLADESSVSTSTTAILGALLIQAQNIWHKIVQDHGMSPAGRQQE